MVGQYLTDNINLGTLITAHVGSCHGRGPRAAGWFRDYLADQGDGDIQSIILTGGIKGWATAGGEFVEYMDGYDESVWVAKD